MDKKLPQLFGDGVNDDAPAIQAMLDSGATLVYLPVPTVHYTIGKTLFIHSNQELRLDRFTTIKLMDNQNCIMLQNADPINGDKNIKITGGIWDMNGYHQRPSPFADGSYFKALQDDGWETLNSTQYYPGYFGVGMRFCHVQGFHLSGITLKDAATFGVQMAFMEGFTVEDITFDYLGNPRFFNKDGIHLDGSCRFGILRNLKGACHDDLVALNADDIFPQGPIEDILIDGIFAEDCHSAVRMLTNKSWIRNIHITNVYGTYYQYCVCLSKCYGGKTDIGFYDHITIDNLYVSKAPRYSKYERDGEYIYSLIWIESGLDIRSLSLREIYRRENAIEGDLPDTKAIPLLCIMPETEIRSLAIENMEQENLTGIPFPMISNQGTIHKLYLNNVRSIGEEPFQNEGCIDMIAGSAEKW